MKGMLLVMYGFFILLILQTRILTKFVVPEACFHAEPIGTSPVKLHLKWRSNSSFLVANSLQPYYRVTTVENLGI